MSKQSLAQKSVYWLKVISLGLILGLGIQFAQAWTPPGAAPPGGNVSGPITTSSASQTKAGGFGSASLYVTNGVQFNSYRNCDLKTDASGNFSCGTDATGSGMDISPMRMRVSSNWAYLGYNNADYNGAGLATTNVFAQGEVTTPQICFTDTNGNNRKCKTDWPSGGDNLGNHTATQDLNMSAKKITNVATPTNGTDGANKDYVDGKSMKVFSGVTTPGNCLSAWDSSHQLCQDFFTQTIAFPSAFTSVPEVIVSAGAPLDPGGCTGFAGDSFAVVKGAVTKTGFTVSSGYSPLGNSSCGVAHEGWEAQLSVNWMAIGN